MFLLANVGVRLVGVWIIGGALSIVSVAVTTIHFILEKKKSTTDLESGGVVVGIAAFWLFLGLALRSPRL